MKGRTLSGIGVRLSRVLRIGVLTASLAATALAAGSASAAVPLARVGEIARLPHDARISGMTAPGTMLRLTVILRSRNPQALESFATAVSTPGDPRYHRYLTVGEFATRFGSTAARIAAVEKVLRAGGLEVGRPNANDLTLPVLGSASRVEHALSVSLARGQIAGRTAYANEQPPALPVTIAPYVQGIIGLDDVTPDQPAGIAMASGRTALARSAARPHVDTGGGPQPCSAAITAQASHEGSLTADEVATAYSFSGLYGAGDLGAGQTVALLEQEPYDPTDIAAYQACYQTSASITNVNVDGGPGTYQAPPAGSGDAESALGIEQVIGQAPKANILVYQGPDTSTVDILSAIVSQDLAKVIASSYGVCEALAGATVISAEDTLLQEAAIQGQSFYVGSGDSGANACYQADHSNESLSVSDPAAQPFATAVGGTTLYTTTGCSMGACYYEPGDQPSQGVWNDGVDAGADYDAAGGGGGLSSQFTMPAYQATAPASLNVVNLNSSAAPCGGATLCREVPDVSADADPYAGYLVYADGQWESLGGTSAAAPLWAAFTALANASAACRGSAIGFANPALYDIAGRSYLDAFYDVTSASPFSTQSNNDALYDDSVPGNLTDLYPVGIGYDMATGLGSMIAPQLAASLCALASPVYTVRVDSPGSRRSVAGRAVSLQLSGADSGGAGLHYAATGLPAGLTISATGLITGTPTSAESTTVTVTATDAFTNAGSTQFTWTVVEPGLPTIPGFSFGGVGRDKPNLSFRIRAGTDAPPLRSVAITLPRGLRFARRGRRLERGVAVRARRARYTLRRHGATLTITFGSGVTAATITLTRPALTASAAEVTKAHRNKLRKVRLYIKATDTARASVTYRVTLRKLS